MIFKEKVILKKLTIVIIYMLGFGIFRSSAQIKASLGFGASSYTGDLSSWTPRLSETKAGVTFGLSYDITNQFRLRFNATNATISGSDKNSPRYDLRERNLSFKSKITEFALLGEFDIYLNEDPTFIPYVFAGPGFFHFDPTTVDKNGKIVYLRNVGTEGQFLKSNPPGKGQQYSLTQFNMQYGIGIKTQLTENVAIGLEMSIRQLFTDYLDDIHANRYIDPSYFIAEGQLQALELTFRGFELNPPAPQYLDLPRGLNDRDSYQSLQLRVTVNLSSKSYYTLGGGNKEALRQMRCKKVLF